MMMNLKNKVIEKHHYHVLGYIRNLRVSHTSLFTISLHIQIYKPENKKAISHGTIKFAYCETIYKTLTVLKLRVFSVT